MTRARWISLLVVLLVAPVTAIAQVTFDPGASPEVETRRLSGGQLLVKPLINGRDVGWFIVDTGAGINCIETEVARRLRLPVVGSGQHMGVGGQRHGFESHRVDDFHLGPAHVQNLTFAGIDMSFMGRTPMEINGIIGEEVFEQLVFRIDVDRPSVEVFDPFRYDPEGVPWEHLNLPDGRPTIDIEFEGVHGRFFIDTGAGSAFSINSPTVRRHDLLDFRETRTVRTMGSTGPNSTQRGRLDYMIIAGERIDDPVGNFSTNRSGPTASRRWDGTLGNIAFRPFVVTYDYTNQRIAFERRQEPALEQDELVEYVGTYRIDGRATRTLSIEDGRLLSQRSGSRPFEIRPLGDDAFVFVELWVSAEFVRDDRGDVTHMIVHQPGGIVEKAEKVR